MIVLVKNNGAQYTIVVSPSKLLGALSSKVEPSTFLMSPTHYKKLMPQ
jgi:hypothetical protein